MSVDWTQYKVDGNLDLTLGHFKGDYPSALRLIEGGVVTIKVRKPPYHSVSGAGALGRAVSLLIRAGLATHAQMQPRAVLAVDLTDTGKKVLAELEREDAARHERALKAAGVLRTALDEGLHSSADAYRKENYYPGLKED